ncbi:hypothetical protein FB45DRAFT_1039485 [Roridomyces roridus]|uniref:Uncharacterized protein n=1 Tax=Roridomyces roridus TaxID=1738132 RepID=A0AAD7B2L5_9AGAR|nr:hypothetical protein FB45DRAFT_1039485 [Roridomyces roridus]
MPTIPLELERMIFEIAYRSQPWDEKLAEKLGQVAPRVEYWINLIRYKSVHLGHSGHLVTHHSNLIDTQPSWLLVQRSQRLDNWALVSELGPAARELPFFRQFPLNQLYIEYALFTEVVDIRIPEAPVYPNLTHLSLTFYESDDLGSSSALLGTISQFPRLTHFAFDGPGRPSDALLKKFRSALPDLQCIAFSWKRREEPRNDYLFDQRIVELGGNEVRLLSSDEWPEWLKISIQ